MSETKPIDPDLVDRISASIFASLILSGVATRVEAIAALLLVGSTLIQGAGGDEEVLQKAAHNAWEHATIVIDRAKEEAEGEAATPPVVLAPGPKTFQ